MSDFMVINFTHEYAGMTAQFRDSDNPQTLVDGWYRSPNINAGKMLLVTRVVGFRIVRIVPVLVPAFVFAVIVFHRSYDYTTAGVQKKSR
jgi:hypothetical protein